MSIRTNLPQVKALKMAVQDKIGRPMTTHSDFTILVEDIEMIFGVHTSESTYERLWNYSTRSCDSISVHTLDVLCKYLGFNNWNDYLLNCAMVSPIESEMIPKGVQIDAATVAQGTRLRLSWLPDRQMTIECIGPCRFVVREILNSSGIRVGDTFSALVFQKGRELYLDNYISVESDGQPQRYVVGQKNGLAEVELLSQL